MQIAESNIFVLDFETTGSVKGYPNTPWQIGAVPVRGGKVILEEAFTSLLYVPKSQPFNPYAPGRWASLRNELASAPTLQTLWPELHGRMNGTIPCAHNIGTERTILTTAFPFHQFGKWIDTLGLARRCLTGLHDYKLQTVVTALGLQEKLSRASGGLQPHDALYDAMAAAFFLEFLFESPGWDSLDVERIEI